MRNVKPFVCRAPAPPSSQVQRLVRRSRSFPNRVVISWWGRTRTGRKTLLPTLDIGNHINAQSQEPAARLYSSLRSSGSVPIILLGTHGAVFGRPVLA